LANSKQAAKRARQAENRRQRHSSMRSSMRTSIKNVKKALEKGEKELAVEEYKKAVPIIDSAANKGLLDKNKAARHKSRLNSQIKSM